MVEFDACFIFTLMEKRFIKQGYLLKGPSVNNPDIMKMIEPSFMGLIVSDDVFGACPTRLLRWKG